MLKFFISCPSSALAPDHVWPLVDFWLDVDVSVACFCDGSDAPLHVLSVEFQLCFGDVVVELLDGLGVVCALLVGDAKSFDRTRSPLTNTEYTARELLLWLIKQISILILTISI